MDVRSALAVGILVRLGTALSRFLTGDLLALDRCAAECAIRAEVAHAERQAQRAASPIR
ncbi:MAG: hypothetical protein ACRDV9_06595 [Acidimicrobiia bacterium]